MGEAKRRREAACHCGSGLRYEKCCMKEDRKPRFQGFTFTPTEDAVLTGMRISPNGAVELFSGDQPAPIADVRPTEWRETTKGLKIKSQAFGEMTACIGSEVSLDRADYVFGVDTNTITRSGETVHVSCLTCATRQIAFHGYDGTVHPIMCVDFKDTEYPPERIGWLLAIETIISSKPKAGADIVLWTDHDLNALPAINNREAPLVADRYLPDGFRLGYASDKGSAVPNKVIKAAHKGASKVADLVLKEGLVGQLILPYLFKEPHAQFIRRWINDGNSIQFFY